MAASPVIGPLDPGHDRDLQLHAGGPGSAVADVLLQHSLLHAGWFRPGFNLGDAERPSDAALTPGLLQLSGLWLVACRSETIGRFAAGRCRLRALEGTERHPASPAVAREDPRQRIARQTQPHRWWPSSAMTQRSRSNPPVGFGERVAQFVLGLLLLDRVGGPVLLPVIFHVPPCRAAR